MPTDPERRIDLARAVSALAALGQKPGRLDLAALVDVIWESFPLGAVTAVGLSLVDADNHDIFLQALSRGPLAETIHIPFDLGSTLIPQVAGGDQPLLLPDLLADAQTARELAIADAGAALLLPLPAQGRVRGVLSVLYPSPGPFAEAELAPLRALGDLIGVLLRSDERADRLEQQASRLNTLLDATGDAVILTTWGRIQHINAAAESLFERRSCASLGMPLADAPLLAPIRAGLERALTSLALFRFEDEIPPGRSLFEARLDDGRILAVTVAPACLSADTLIDWEGGWVIVAQDVTHRRAPELVRLAPIRAAAHDLLNPLGVILGALTMLESDLGEVSPLQQEIISIALQSVDRMQTLIDHLVTLEDLEHGPDLQPIPVDLREVIERSVIDLQQPCEERGQFLRLDLPDELPPLLGDPGWLGRALAHLLHNAHKFTPPGGEITVRAYGIGQSLCLEVQDTGPGIPGEAQRHLFERFYRGPHPNGEVKGFGLGLALVKAVVDRHGGRVYVRSDSGQGSTFGMIFPLPP